MRGNDHVGWVSRRRRLGSRARVNRIPDRGGSDVAIPRPPAFEHRQSRRGVEREPGDHLRVFVSIDVLLLDDDVPHEGLEHLGRHTTVSLQEFTKLRERGNGEGGRSAGVEAHARMESITWPWTSVSRRSMPLL